MGAGRKLLKRFSINSCDPNGNESPQYDRRTEIRGRHSDRQTTAVHRVLVDLGQVLASFNECVVVVGGWVPDLLLQDILSPFLTIFVEARPT